MTPRPLRPPGSTPRLARCLGWLAAALCLLAGSAAADDELQVLDHRLTASVGETLVQVRAELTLQATGEGWRRAVLLRGPLRLTDVEAGEAVSLAEAGNAVVAATETSGRHTLRLDFTVPLQRREKTWTFSLPGMAGAQRRATVTVPGRRVAARLSGRHPLAQRREEGATRLTIQPVNARPLVLTLSPESRRPDAATRLAVQAAGAVEVRPAEALLDLEYACQVLDGTAAAVQIPLPEGWLVRSVRGNGVTAWRPLARPLPPAELLPRLQEAIRTPKDRAAPPALGAVGLLRSDRETSFRLRVRLERPLTEEDRGTLTVPVPVPASTARFGGRVTVAGGEGLVVRLTEVTGGEVASFDGRQGARLEKAPAGLILALTPVRFRYDAALQERLEVWEHAMLVEGRLQVDVRSGEAFQLVCRATPGLRLTAVEGESLQRWRQQGTRVTLETSRALQGETSFRFRGEVPAGDDGWPLPGLLPRDAARTRVLLALLPQNGFDLRREGALRSLAQTEAEKLPAWLRPAALALAGPRLDEEARLFLSRIPASVQAQSLARVTLGDQTVDLELAGLVRVRRAPVFAHRLTLGPGYEILAVTGDRVRDWSYDDDARRLIIRLEKPATGDLRFAVQASRPRGEDPATALALPVYRDATRFHGVLGLRSRPGWQVTVLPRPGLRETTLATARLDEALLPPPDARPESERFFAYGSEVESLTARVEEEPPLLYVREEATVLCDRGRAALEARLSFDLRRGGVETLRLRLPPGFGRAEVLPRPGPGRVPQFRPEDVTREEDGSLRIDFTARRVELDPLRLRADRALTVGDEAPLELTPVAVAEAERLAGTLTIRTAVAEGGGALVEVREASRRGLRRLLAADADEAEAAPGEGVTVLRYGIEGAENRLRLDTRDVGSRVRAAARATDCRLVTRLTDGGLALTKLTCQVENPGAQQFLQVRLPPAAEVWSTYVLNDGDAPEAKKPIKPVRDREVPGRLLVPLTGTNISRKRFSLELAYVQRLPGERLGVAALDLRTPGLRDASAGGGAESNLRIDRLAWEVYVPEAYDLVSHGGTLRLLSGGGSHASRLLRFLLEVLRALWYLLVLLAYALLWVLMWGLVLGVVGLVVWILARGVRREADTIREHPFRTVGAAAGIVLLLAVLVAMMMPNLMSARERAVRIASLNNLKQIGVGIAHYRNRHGRPPPRLEDLRSGRGGLLDRGVLREPGGGEYYYVGAERSPRPDEIVAFALTPEDGGRTPVLFADGHAALLPHEEVSDNLARHEHLAAYNDFNAHWQTREAEKDMGLLAGLKGKRSLATIGGEGEAILNQAASSVESFARRSGGRRREEAGRDTKTAEERERVYNELAEVQKQQQMTLERTNVQRRRRAKGIGDWLESNLGGAARQSGEALAPLVADAPADAYNIPRGEVEEEAKSTLALPGDRPEEPAKRRGGDGKASKETLEDLQRRIAELDTERLPPPPEAPARKPAVGGKGKVETRAQMKQKLEAPIEEDEGGLLGGLFGPGGDDDDAPPPAAEPAPADKAPEAAEPQTPPTAAWGGPEETTAAPDGGEIDASEIMDDAAAEAPDTFGFDGDVSVEAEEARSDGRAARRPAPPAPVGTGMTAGTFPIAIEVPTDGGQRLVFARESASSAAGTIELTCFTKGLSLTLEVLLAVALVAGFWALGRWRPSLAAAGAAAALVLLLAARLWIGTHPHLSVALWVLFLMALVDGGRWLARRLQRRRAAAAA